MATSTKAQLEHRLMVALEPWLATTLPDREDLDWEALGSGLRAVCDAQGLTDEEAVAVLGGILFRHLQEKSGIPCP